MLVAVCVVISSNNYNLSEHFEFAEGKKGSIASNTKDNYVNIIITSGHHNRNNRIHNSTEILHVRYYL